MVVEEDSDEHYRSGTLKTITISRSAEVSFIHEQDYDIPDIARKIMITPLIH